ncbi:hypothetical protein S40293_10048 [Stachybotrys chartarum IBT 40293]|nr:hypothetical protein S40293_10048 [Stachybotrys chartarum IBT 40293]
MHFPVSIVAHAAAISDSHIHSYVGRLDSGSHDVARVLVADTGHVYLYDYDGSSLTQALDYTVAGDPSWVAFREPDLLYAVDEWSGNVSLHRLDLAANTGELVTTAAGSLAAVHLEFNREGTRMMSSAYGDQAVDVWDVADEGLILLRTIASPGEPGPDPDRQTESHPHQTVLDPSGRFFTVNDLGTDSVLVIDAQDDLFEIVETLRVEPAGCGPRHSVFYPAGTPAATHLFIVCELTNQVLAYSVAYTGSSLSFAKQQEISTFDPRSPPATPDAAAAGEIALASNNADLYVSNRLTGDPTDSIAHFRVNPAWAEPLALMNLYSTGGQLPRMFTLNCASELFVANQDGDGPGVAILQRNADGTLVETPKASIPMSVFGGVDEPAPGPKYIKQIA